MQNKPSPFSNRSGDVFLIKLEKQLDRGALISRYSRTSALDIRDVYDREFENNPDRGRGFYRRVFSQYGDESVSELMSAQLGIQKISNIAAKYIEDLRIGLSFIEKSSRYVRYDRKVNGRFLYLEAEDVGLSGELADSYTDLCDRLFSFYADSYNPLKEHIAHLYPIEECSFSNRAGSDFNYADLNIEETEIAQKAYDSAVRARALDDLRYVLPASTLTNLGVSGNARSFSYMVLRLFSAPAPELKRLGSSILDELSREFPEVMQTADSQRGSRTISYLNARRGVAGREPHTGSTGKKVELIGYLPEEVELKKMMLANAVRRGNEWDISQDRNSFVDSFARIRNTKRDRPPREFEIPRYDFMITTNFGAFRDLHRHRMMTMVRGDLTPNLGFDLPRLLAGDSGTTERFTELMQDASDLWAKIAGKYGNNVAQYCIPFAYRYQVYVSMSLREATHLCELRSTPQAHIDLREMAADITAEISRVHPSLSRIMKYVDTAEYPLGRIFAEFRKEQKLS